MTCATCEQMIDPLVDEELTTSEADEARAHIESCPQCAARMSERVELSRRLRAMPRYTAPDVLRARLRGIGTAPVVQAAAATSRASYFRWATLAAAAVIAILVTGQIAVQRSARDAVQDEVLASHLRSLLPGQLIDVESTDRHNVKPWFNGRIALSPDVPDLDSAGYKLVGGRIDYAGATPAAVVVYRRRQHVISVFSWPSTQRIARPSTEVRNGFQIIHLGGNGVEKWIVSDLNRQELEDFSRRFSGYR